MENYSSDGDHGMGHALLKHIREQDMSDCVCIVMRDCELGFSHLGNRRFELMCKTGGEAMNELR